MSEAQHAAAGADEAPVNPYSLLEAVNESSDTVHTGWLIFIGIMSYLLVAVAGVTHKDLLLSRDIPLPLLQVPIELTKFFLFAPIVLVLFHVGIVTQLVMLARKTLELDKALQILEVSDRRTHPLRLELHNFFFVQAIAGPDRSRIVGGLLHGLSWLSLVVLPVVLLLYVQISFLPYHDVTITWAHRIALVVDVGMLALLGVFLSRPEQSLGRALVRAGVGHPLTSIVTIAVLGGVAMFSFLVATVPGERLDRLGQRLLGTPAAGTPGELGRGTAAYGFVVPFLGWSVDGRLFGLFERNLNVTDQDLVNDKDVTPGEVTLIFRRRDLRYARLDRSDLHQADLAGANLDGASLVGTDLRGVSLHCADANMMLLSGDRQAARCPSARGANFTKARLSKASLIGLDLSGAWLEDADLADAKMTHAILMGTNFYGAHLERADLSGGVALQGANLGAAALQGADLNGAKLHGADLSSAGLQGANLDFASLHGASLAGAELEGASLFQAQMPGANLSDANVRAADLRLAWIWMAQPPALEKSELVDLGDVRTSTATSSEVAQLEAMLQGVQGPGLNRAVRGALERLLEPAAVKPLTAVERDNARGWAALFEMQRREASGAGFLETTSGTAAALSSGAGSGGQPSAVQDQGQRSDGVGRRDGLRSRLTRYLGDLACRVRWADGAVATGLARRAQGETFTGEITTLYERLRSPTCPASLTITSSVLKSLAARADTARGR